MTYTYYFDPKCLTDPKFFVALRWVFKGMDDTNILLERMWHC